MANSIITIVDIYDEVFSVKQGFKYSSEVYSMIHIQVDWKDGSKSILPIEENYFLRAYEFDANNKYNRIHLLRRSIYKLKEKLTIK